MDDRALNAEVDRLYQLPPDQFIKARNELAKRVGGAQASAMRALAKPNLLAWALNQLYWSKRKTFDGLVAAAARLRATQAEALLGKRVDLRATGEAHREAIRETLQQAAAILRDAGHPASPDAIRELTGALEALPWKDAGRLVRPPAASGFEALAGLPVSPQRSSQPSTAGEGEKRSHGQAEPERREREAGRSSAAARRDHAAALKAAREAAHAARREEAHAGSRLEHAEKEVEAAARREEAAREAVRRAEGDRARAEEERRAAAAALDAARRASADAARRLGALSSHGAEGRSTEL